MQPNIDFSNILSKTAIERLADVDEYEVVREVQVSTRVFMDVPYDLICNTRNTSQITHQYCHLCSP